MGMKLPLTGGQLRLAVITTVICLAIYLVLYTSAFFQTATTTEPRHQRDAVLFDDSAAHTKDRISFKARWKPNRIFADTEGFVRDSRESDRGQPAGRASEYEGSESGDILVGDQRTRHAHQRQSGGREKPRMVKLISNFDRSLSSPFHKMASPHHPTPKTKPESPTMAAPSKSDHEFDAEVVLKLFQGCKAENGDLSIDCYNDAYEELCKLFKPLGTIFNFVTSDIVEKIGILRDYRKSDIGEHFVTIQSMVKYEVDNKLTVQKKKASGCRTLLRLHRALEFISALLTKIRSTDNSGKFSSEATEAYDCTLARFHPWLIKKAVHVAMYTLPYRPHLLVKMKVEDTPEGMARVEALIQQLNQVYDITQELYTAHSLLDLP